MNKNQKGKKCQYNGFDFILYENYDIALAMSSSRADPVLGHCPGWGYLNK